MNINKLPKNISVFPLSDVVFFPKTVLPLNIFEKRYIQLVNDCMRDQRLFGMIQPKKTVAPKDIYEVGCLGKIINFNETSDGRFIINLSGIIRFRIIKELDSSKLYRKFSVDYSDFLQDLKIVKNNTKYNKKDFLKKIEIFFKKKNYLININELEKHNFEQLINTLCMISPISVVEKQKLVETTTSEEKIQLFENIINFNLADRFKNKTIQ